MVEGRVKSQLLLCRLRLASYKDIRRTYGFRMQVHMFVIVNYGLCFISLSLSSNSQQSLIKNYNLIPAKAK